MFQTAQGVLAVALSLATALCFAGGYVLQYHEAHEAPDRLFLSPKMLLELARHRIWVAGIIVMFIGNGLQAIALAVGSLAVVEPFLCTALLFALPLSAAWRRERLTRRDWTAALCVCIGLGVLLGVGSPGSVSASTPQSVWLMVGLASWGSALGLVAIARRVSSPAPKAALIGGAAGILFGLQDALTQYCLHAMSHHMLALALSWQPYVQVTTGIYAIVLMQSAYKAGPLTAALPPIAVGEPLAGILIGVVALGAHLNASPAAMGFETAGGLIMAAGTWTLARSPLVCGRYHPTRLAHEARAQIESRLQPVKEAAKRPAWVRARFATLQAVTMYLIFRR
jgi:drug/metabolite transporter (DMT)-like permease